MSESGSIDNIDNSGKTDAKELQTLKTEKAVAEAKTEFEAKQKLDAERASKLSSKDNITMPKAEFKDMQTRMLTLETEATDAKKAAELSTRNNLFSSLEQMNPKLAKLNEKSSSAVLQVVLDTAREMKEGFPSIKGEKVIEGATAGKHDETHYDFVKGEFVYS